MYKQLTAEEYDIEFLEAKQNLAIVRYENISTYNDKEDDSSTFDIDNNEVSPIKSSFPNND